LGIYRHHHAGGQFGVRHLRRVRFERDLISDRTKAVLASARARGRKGGAPFKMTAAKVRLAMAAMGEKETKVTDYAANWLLPGKRSTGTSRQMGRCARMG
jgi:DNA invertase Pin-like site-specific DNA recombinase